MIIILRFKIAGAFKLAEKILAGLESLANLCLAQMRNAKYIRLRNSSE